MQGRRIERRGIGKVQVRHERRTESLWTRSKKREDLEDLKVEEEDDEEGEEEARGGGGGGGGGEDGELPKARLGRTCRGLMGFMEGEKKGTGAKRRW